MILKRKYILKLTRRGISGLILMFFFASLWMFVLGIFVGRKTVPVKLDMMDIKEKIASLKLEGRKKDASIESGSKISGKKKRLDFYETLKDNRDITHPEHKTGGNKSASYGKAEDSKTVRKKQKASTSKTLDVKQTYTIQVASVKNKETARKMVADLKKRGYSAYQKSANIPKLGIWFRVRVGHYRSRDEARSAIEGLKKRNFKPIFIKEEITNE